MQGWRCIILTYLMQAKPDPCTHTRDSFPETPEEPCHCFKKHTLFQDDTHVSSSREHIALFNLPMFTCSLSICPSCIKSSRLCVCIFSVSQFYALQCSSEL